MGGDTQGSSGAVMAAPGEPTDLTYLWTIQHDYPEELIGEYDRNVGPDRFLFRQGKPLECDKRPTFRFRATRERLEEYDDLANNAMIPLVNGRVASILRAVCPNDCQLVNARVVTVSGELAGYAIVNVLSRASGIDHSASQYTLIPGTSAIMGFRKLQHKRGCLGSHELARDTEYMSHVLISERLRAGFVEGKLRGLGLYLPSQMY